VNVAVNDVRLSVVKYDAFCASLWIFEKRFEKVRRRGRDDVAVDRELVRGVEVFVGADSQSVGKTGSSLPVSHSATEAEHEKEVCILLRLCSRCGHFGRFAMYLSEVLC
jgi:hypothetical protein